MPLLFCWGAMVIEHTLERIRVKHLQRMDDDNWKTINGTHVEIGDDGEITKGPERLRNVSYSSIRKKRVNKLESGIKSGKTETAIIYNDKGEEIARRHGTENACEIPPENEVSLKGMRLTHNHPSGTTFSAEDLAVFQFRELKEIRAVGSTGTTFSLRLKDPSKCEGKNFALDYHNARMKFEKENCDPAWESAKMKYSAGAISVKQLNSIAKTLNQQVYEYRRKWLKENAESYGFVYTEENNGEDV